MNFTHNEKDNKKNLTGITIVVLLHVLVAYGVVTGLGKRLVSKMIEPVETKIIEEVAPPPPKELPPPPPPPEMKAPPPPFIPPVEVNVQQPPPQQSVISSATNTPPPTKDLQKAPPAAPPAQPAPPSKAAPTLAKGDLDRCKPEWPKSSLRNEETGTVVVAFLVGVDGRVVEAKVEKSSGFRDLDKAAQQGLSKCVFKPASQDGHPVQEWTKVQYVWSLE